MEASADHVALPVQAPDPGIREKRRMGDAERKSPWIGIAAGIAALFVGPIGWHPFFSMGAGFAAIIAAAALFLGQGAHS